MDELGPAVPAEKESREEMSVSEFWVVMELIAILTIGALVGLHYYFLP